MKDLHSATDDLREGQLVAAISRVLVILFDVGNTLLHVDYEFIATLPACREAGARPEDLLRAEVAARPEADAAYAAGLPDRQAVSRYFRVILRGVELSEERLEETIELLRQRHSAWLLGSVVRLGTREAAQEIRQRGYMVGVVSNSDSSVERLLAERGFSGYFEFVIDSGP